MDVLEHEVGSVEWDTLPSPASARRAWLEFRQANGLKSATALLTAPTAQPKAKKNKVATYVLHLAPAGLSGLNTCPWSSPGCREACLNTAGRGRFSSVQLGRVLRTRFLAENPQAFVSILEAEIRAAIKRHGKVGVRLNGTSDIRWERVVPWIFKMKGARFYDYTKAPRRDVTANYALTYSVSERDTLKGCAKMAERYGRLAVVVDIKATDKKTPLPKTWQGLRVADGDVSDWRFERGPVAVLLRAKGSAIGDSSGFVKVAR